MSFEAVKTQAVGPQRQKRAQPEGRIRAACAMEAGDSPERNFNVILLAS